MTTGDRVWESYPLPVDEFGYGSGRLFTDAFRSDAAWGREEKIRSQKALLARGLQYASSRGIKTCLGFEVSGDPKVLSDPNPDRRFLISDYQLSSLPAGTDMTVRCAASDGGAPARDVTLQVLFPASPESPESNEWTEIPMVLKERCVFQATLPGDRIPPGWVRYQIIAKSSQDPVAWPGFR